jgi:L-fuconate dehydratase
VTEHISSVEAIDVRFPTSRHRDGSDAMNPFPDYSAAYLILRTSTGAEGHGLVFTVGRGTEIEVAAIRSLASMVVGQPVEELLRDPGALARRLVGDSQIRWLGPEQGVVHMAAGGIVNAVRDLAARRAGKPLWKLLADLTPEQLVAQIDFRYLRDALTPDDALDLLRTASTGRAEREQRLLADGYELIKLKVGESRCPDLAKGQLSWPFCLRLSMQ